MRERIRTNELMDDPALPAAEHDHALAGLARLNAWSRSHRLLWDGIAKHARKANAAGRTLRVLDVATGSGDAPIALAKRAHRAGLKLSWTLVDCSAHALSVAESHAREAQVEVKTLVADIVARPLPCEADVVTCSLFLHHCERDGVKRALQHMAQAARTAVGVTDLDRTHRGLWLAWLGSRILSRSPVVHFDAIASVRAAWTPQEMQDIAAEAGLASARCTQRWPARWTMWWRAP
jgi:2-polyprenyl-3-methyl-5-hydroxy-6-metoxy-1,4-benzoquinol methylase